MHMTQQLISKHIDDVGALGDIGLVNSMDEIAKALVKNRGL